MVGAEYLAHEMSVSKALRGRVVYDLFERSHNSNALHF